MAQKQVSNDEFLTQLERLFESSSKAHSVFVTHKRVSRDANAGTSSTFPIVVRATDGRGTAGVGRTKFTTHVESSNIKSFQEAYSNILRTSTAAFLRKRDKAKERRVDKMLKEKRKKIEESLKISEKGGVNNNGSTVAGANGKVTSSGSGAVKVTQIGSKRGAGRRKRQQARRKAQALRRERTKARAAAGKATGADGGGAV